MNLYNESSNNLPNISFISSTRYFMYLSIFLLNWTSQYLKKKKINFPLYNNNNYFITIHKMLDTEELYFQNYHDVVHL